MLNRYSCFFHSYGSFNSLTTKNLTKSMRNTLCNLLYLQNLMQNQLDGENWVFRAIMESDGWRKGNKRGICD